LRARRADRPVPDGQRGSPTASSWTTIGSTRSARSMSIRSAPCTR
jgi:hypothetical protein